ncbi:TonB C-terminal domain-containing protein [Tsuneonella sp. YG55]|uniref:TonB C-terminal domain-containing protein n=1 Tax=Tsuneonella litorea TaxID=2976475 RepID=A0A9X3A935_9SPHN|nr:TonB C-terminal domain-containing protein [Tsuneonella litorea]MCT2558480.1 TonB C-terminal domain-containing protein [Tsuneonella litorea]
MVFAHLRREERIGLGIAVVLHLGLAAAFLLQPSKRDVLDPAPRMTVNLTTDVGLEATAPEPVPESAAAIAPTLAPEPAPLAEPEPVVRPMPEVPRPKPVERTVARPAPKPSPVSTEPRRRPDAPSRSERSTPKPAGGNRIGADFLPGAGDSTTTRETRVPASQIGASAKASLFQAIARELRPKWQPPSGPEVEELITKVRFRLNPDGSLSGSPEVVRQSGITDLNKPQAGRHGEQAIRAVRLAAPFDLPEEYYEAWKVVTVDFDWKLSQ